MILPSLMVEVCYVISSILFIFGLKLLGRPESARRGNFISALGMFIAVVSTLLGDEIIHWQWILIGILIGSLIGVFVSRWIAMTAIPEMVALFNGLGGLSSLLIGVVEYLKIINSSSLAESSFGTLFIISITIFIGGITFTGSLIAWGKLSSKIATKPLLYRGQNFINIILFLILLIVIFFNGPLFSYLDVEIAVTSFQIFLVLVVISGIIGITTVLPIGGGDMPVVISLLNSYSGMAACAAGFIIGNNVLIVSGALVGSSGIILTKVMCRSMNRKLTNVLFSGFGSGGTAAVGDKKTKGEVKPIVVEDTYSILEAASNVLIIPGYGMAVSQAQHVVQELTVLLENNGSEVNFGIHPVAGRMPGHMNVLLAESNIPYEQLKEMDDVNPTMKNVDVAIVIGANDVVNPLAREEGSLLYGMPIINVDEAKIVIVLKRSMNTGFAGVQNSLFFNDNTRMLFGNAKTIIQDLITEFK